MSGFLGCLAGMRMQRSIGWIRFGKQNCGSSPQPLNVERAFMGSRISEHQVLFNEKILKSICLRLRYDNLCLRLEEQRTISLCV